MVRAVCSVLVPACTFHASMDKARGRALIWQGGKNATTRDVGMATRGKKDGLTHRSLDPVGAANLPSHLVCRRCATSALAGPLAFFTLVAWMLLGCVPVLEYRPPNHNELHALVKVRLVYRAWSGPELEQLVTIDGHDIREIPLPVQHGIPNL